MLYNKIIGDIFYRFLLYIMPSKKSSLMSSEQSIYNVMRMTYNMIRKSIRPHGEQAPLKTDAIDPRFIGRDGLIKTQVMPALTKAEKEKIKAALTKADNNVMKAEEALRNDPTYFEILTNILNPTFLRDFIPPVRADDGDDGDDKVQLTPEEIEIENQKKALEKQKEEKEREQSEQQKPIDTLINQFGGATQKRAVPALVPKTKIDKEQEKLRRDEEIKQIQIRTKQSEENIKAMRAQIIDEKKQEEQEKSRRDEEIKQEEKKALQELKEYFAKQEAIKARKKELDKRTSFMRKAKKQGTQIDETREEQYKQAETIMTSLDEYLKNNPELKQTASDAKEEITKILSGREFKGVGLDSSNINAIVSSLPSDMKNTLGPAIRGLMGTNISMNDVTTGLTALALAQTGIDPRITAPVMSFILNTYGVNLNDVLLRPIATPGEALGEPGAGSSDSTLRRNMRIGGAVGLVAALGGVRFFELSPQDMITRLMASGYANAISTVGMEQVSDYVSSYFTSQGLPVPTNIAENLKMLEVAVPAIATTVAGAVSPGGRPLGEGVISGEGITEKKTTTDKDVIRETKVMLDQKASGNKIWQPKAISPTTDILDETQQEKYADDLEFIAFNYIPPTSEGASGTVDTNPLKYSQAKADNIRYTNAGMYIPYLLWNTINDANEMTKKNIETLALGPKLPEMKFLNMDNETTFEQVATIQYVNNENTAIEFMSPYSDFSNVDNFWGINEDSVLYTINP